MNIAVIIPTLNEEDFLPSILKFMKKHLSKQQIVLVDGGSDDRSVALAQDADVQLIRSPVACRAIQMNLGANIAESADVLYFVHCDTMPPHSFVKDIQEAISQGADLGCYRFQFDRSRGLMRFNAFLTRFPALFCRGGDQSLFVKNSVFKAIGGFDENKVIMEDYDFIKKARSYTFKIIPKNIIVSSRKYETNSYWKVQGANILIYTLYVLGISPCRLKKWYSSLLK